MTLPTHLVAGLIIGKLTGNYTVSLIGSAAVDLDHLIAYYRNGILSKPKRLIAAVINKTDSLIDQRNYFHNIFFFTAITVIVLIVNFKIGLVFSLAYLGHLILDSLDNMNYFPFYPNKKINLRGPIKYFSQQEFFFAIVLFFIFLII